MSSRRGIAVYRFLSPAGLDLRQALGYAARPMIRSPVPILPILYVDQHIVVADKPAGLLSVPGRGADKADCLLSRVQAEFDDALAVHRLDMETSGLIVLARGAAMHRKLSMRFEARQVSKAYVAVVAGTMAGPCGEIDLPLIADWPNRPRQIVDPIRGKPSLTRWRMLAYDAATDTSRLMLEPVTGRSHQLRVHLASLGHPILGDSLYADDAVRLAAPRMLLHACMLDLGPAEDEQTPWRFESPVPF